MLDSASLTIIAEQSDIVDFVTPERRISDIERRLDEIERAVVTLYRMSHGGPSMYISQSDLDELHQVIMPPLLERVKQLTVEVKL